MVNFFKMLAGSCLGLFVFSLFFAHNSSAITLLLGSGPGGLGAPANKREVTSDPLFGPSADCGQDAFDVTQDDIDTYGSGPSVGDSVTSCSPNSQCLQDHGIEAGAEEYNWNEKDGFWYLNCNICTQFIIGCVCKKADNN